MNHHVTGRTQTYTVQAVVTNCPDERVRYGKRTFNPRRVEIRFARVGDDPWKLVLAIVCGAQRLKDGGLSENVVINNIYNHEDPVMAPTPWLDEIIKDVKPV